MAVKVKQLHKWDVTPKHAIRIQNELRDMVIRTDCLSSIRTIAGMDVGLKKDTAKAAVMVLSFPELEIIDYVVCEAPIKFPYIPGLLSFREIPPLILAFECLKVEPDLIICDGQGIAHPRRLGIASHLGLLLDKPTIGCAKSRLCGSYADPGARKGEFEHLYDKKEVIGAAVRTRDNVSWVYVSPGHKISIKSAVDCILRCCTKYRLPRPIRLAHQIAGGMTPTILSSCPNTRYTPTELQIP